ncbi:MAG: DUF423 domain-containing protein [Gammaproteobacteria bacterium]|nr:DUF423 domain-containing protein [Gammaproteobacteria bacterium]
MNPRVFLVSGLGLMIAAVLLGAFGAHALKAMLNEHQIQLWKTASDYHFYHALGLILLGLWSHKNILTRLEIAAGICLLLGVLIFSGSLYLLAISGISKLGMLTPFGGLLFIAGWSLWLVSALRRHPA